MGRFSDIGILSQVGALPPFYEDTFNRASVGADWDITKCLSAVITNNKLVVEANANTWNDLTNGVKHTFASPLIGDFVAETNLEYVARSTDFAMLYMIINLADGGRLSLGINDSWGVETPRFNAYSPSANYQSGGNTEPDNGSVTLKMTRTSGIVRFYRNNVLVLTSSAAHNSNGVNLVLTNTKLTTYNGKTAKWDYVKITQ